MDRTRSASMAFFGISVTVTETVELEGQKAFTLYHIEVGVDNESWRVKKRFSEVLQLAKAIHDRYPKIKLPALPPRRLFGSLSPETVAERREGIEAYLRAISESSILSNFATVRAFLRLPRESSLSGGGGRREKSPEQEERERQVLFG